MATGNQYNLNNTDGRLFFSLVENPVVEPLDGPLFVEHLMARFPEETYSKSRDSHLYKFLTALVGDAGAGLLKKKSLLARLQYESAALSFQDLDSLYSPLMGFDRLPDERYSINAKQSTLTNEEWDAIKAADTAYRKRALGYLQAARQGGTPDGIAAAASAAMGRSTQVVENYRRIFDELSDDPTGLPKSGRTNSTSEFVIKPHVSANDINKSEYATLVFDPDAIGDFRFVLNNEYSAKIFTANMSQTIIESVLIGLESLDTGDVSVARSTTKSYVIKILKSSISVQRLTIVSDNLTSTEVSLQQSAANDLFYFANVGDPSAEYYEAFVKGDDTTDLSERPVAASDWSPTYLDPSAQRNLDNLVNKIKPVSSSYSITPTTERYITVGTNSVFASSEKFVTSRFVSYNTSIAFGTTNKLANRFIEVGAENEERNYAFTGYDMPVVFTTVNSVIAYSGTALSDSTYNTQSFYTGSNPKYKSYESVHIGKFFDPVPLLPGYSFLNNVEDTMVFDANHILPANNTNAIFKGAATA